MLLGVKNYKFGVKNDKLSKLELLFFIILLQMGDLSLRQQMIN